MPLTSCPECHSAMTVVPRADVLIDVCPSCRGVWLDGGELEKILVETRRSESERLGNEALAEGHAPLDASGSRGNPRPDETKKGKKGKKKKKSMFDLGDLLGDLFD